MSKVHENLVASSPVSLLACVEKIGETGDEAKNSVGLSSLHNPKSRDIPSNTHFKLIKSVQKAELLIGVYL